MTTRRLKTWQRLSQMTWDELRTRSSQEIGKRIDLLAYKAGYDFTPPPLAATTKSTGKFFFDAGEISERVELIHKFLPQEIDLILKEAEGICRHRFNLLGYENLDFGTDIDWHLDSVHGKRAPLKPWHTINFLDFNEVGDHKITWELNRHQHLVTLAKAWRITQEAPFVDELVKQWYGWRQANPYPLGINWCSALEVAFRSLSWLWVANLTHDAAVPSGFHADLVSALALNGRYIERYLSTYFSPNTHLIGEAVALFFIGTLCPQIPRSKRWQSQGWGVILREAQRQVRGDGAYFEQALHYHVYALDFFLHARILATRNNVVIPAEFDVVLEKMLDLLEALSQAGPAEGFGDDDGGRVFDPRRNYVEHMTDPLTVGAALYKREHILSAAYVTEEAIWLLGKHAIPTENSRTPRQLHSRAFETGGIYVMASDRPCPQLMMVDAGPQGIGRSGHGHADALSVRLTIEGHRCLVDPGTGVYISDDGNRDVFRGTGAHNTLRIDEQDQAVPDNSFAWTKIPRVKVEQWVTGDSFDFLAASHDGYERFPGNVLHRRFVFRGGDGLWLIRDVAEGQGEHLLESFWHFAEDFEITPRENGVIAASARNRASEFAKPTSLAVMNPQNTVFQLDTGSGMVSPAYGKTVPAPMLRISASVELPAECALLMVAQPREDALGEFVQVTQPRQRLQAYKYETGDATHSFFFADAAGTWSLSAWTSDAEFLYCRVKNDQPEQLVIIKGSFASWHDKPLIAPSRQLGKFEWSAALVRGHKGERESLNRVQ